MSKIEIIVNEIRNPDKKIYLDKIIKNREEHNDINTLIIKNLKLKKIIMIFIILIILIFRQI